MEISVPGYQFVKFLRSGAQAAVVQVTKNDVDYAVRIISDLHNHVNAARAVRELVLLRNCNHENIIEVLDVSVDVQQNVFQRLYITVPLMDFTFEEFAKMDFWRKEKQIAFIRHFMIQILRGVDFLHKNSILHRDLSSKNVMINKNLHLKIIDFGLARELPDLPGGQSWAPCALPYKAPERILQFQFYDSKVDIWSVGCLFAELVSGHRLFLTAPSTTPELQLLQQSFSLEENVPDSFRFQLQQRYAQNAVEFANDRSWVPLENRITFPPPNPEFDDIEAHSAQNGYEVLKNLLRLNPEERWSAEQALTNPFFGDTTPKNGKLKNPDKCQLIFDQINFALENDDINQLTNLLQQQILQAPRL